MQSLDRQDPSCNVPSGDALLGIYTKSSSPPLEEPDLRASRFNVQNAVRRCILRYNGFSTTDILDFEEYNKLPRVVKCTRTRVANLVDVKIDTEISKAFFSGVQFCGSVWTCPCCQAKVSEHRRQEIAQAFEWAYKKQGLKAVMVTFTIPHYHYQKAQYLIDSLTDAFKYLRSGKSYQKWKERIGLRGIIRSLEPLHGINGWHFHTHEVFFVDRETDVREMHNFLINRWHKACDRKGLIRKEKLEAFYDRSIDIVDNANDSDYLSKQDDEKYLKWGADSELAGVLSKKSSSNHPYQLAIKADMGCLKSQDYFMEFLEAFKGKAQLFWSRGLKKDVGLIDKTDDELAKEETNIPKLVTTLEQFGWSNILDKNLRAEVLKNAEIMTEQDFNDWLSSVGSEPLAKQSTSLYFQKGPDSPRYSQ